jgi:hypothetical protein
MILYCRLYSSLLNAPISPYSCYNSRSSSCIPLPDTTIALEEEPRITSPKVSIRANYTQCTDESTAPNTALWGLSDRTNAHVSFIEETTLHTSTSNLPPTFSLAEIYSPNPPYFSDTLLRRTAEIDAIDLPVKEDNTTNINAFGGDVEDGGCVNQPLECTEKVVMHSPATTMDNLAESHPAVPACETLAPISITQMRPSTQDEMVSSVTDPMVYFILFSTTSDIYLTFCCRSCRFNQQHII